MSPEPNENEQRIDALAEDLASEVGREAGPALVTMARAQLLAGAGKPGKETSEFRVTALLVVAGLALIGAGVYGDLADLRAYGVDLLKVVGAAYALSRGLAKAGAAASKPLDR